MTSNSALIGTSTYIGLDFGTSGARAIAIAANGEILAQQQQPYRPAKRLSDQWQQTLWALLSSLPIGVRQRCAAIAIDGTSGTVVLCDPAGQPVAEPLLYNDDRGRSALAGVKHAPADSPAMGATSSLAKVCWWQQTLPEPVQAAAHCVLHQADWLGWLLHGLLGISDYHNALKLGYDAVHLRYPDWLLALAIAPWLPEIYAPGQPVARVRRAIAEQFSLPQTCHIVAGTTDSIAALLASGAEHPGEAVTSLGSTLVLKLLSHQPVSEGKFGIYSHRLSPDLWLVGGASNTGGAVLQHFFTDSELRRLSLQIQPDRPTGLNYYPLLQPGERFPISDPEYPPRLTPRPPDAAAFLQGLLEGIARIEAEGYQLLSQLSQCPVRHVYTAGGGAQNAAWQAIRDRYLQATVRASVGISQQTAAAYGAAQLALRGSNSARS